MKILRAVVRRPQDSFEELFNEALDRAATDGTESMMFVVGYIQRQYPELAKKLEEAIRRDRKTRS